MSRLLDHSPSFQSALSTATLSECRLSRRGCLQGVHVCVCAQRLMHLCNTWGSVFHFWRVGRELCSLSPVCQSGPIDETWATAAGFTFILCYFGMVVQFVCKETQRILHKESNWRLCLHAGSFQRSQFTRKSSLSSLQLKKKQFKIVLIFRGFHK